MKKVIDEKTGRVQVVFNKYELKGSKTCPECGQPLKERDFELLEQLGKRSCIKCGAILLK